MMVSWGWRNQDSCRSGCRTTSDGKQRVSGCHLEMELSRKSQVERSWLCWQEAEHEALRMPNMLRIQYCAVER